MKLVLMLNVGMAPAQNEVSAFQCRAPAIAYFMSLESSLLEKVGLELK